jgi:hypothetical protein
MCFDGARDCFVHVFSFESSMLCGAHLTGVCDLVMCPKHFFCAVRSLKLNLALHVADLIRVCGQAKLL